MHCNIEKYPVYEGPLNHSELFKNVLLLSHTNVSGCHFLFSLMILNYLENGFNFCKESRNKKKERNAVKENKQTENNKRRMIYWLIDWLKNTYYFCYKLFLINYNYFLF